jgi:hypothetical protein
MEVLLAGPHLGERPAVDRGLLLRAKKIRRGEQKSTIKISPSHISSHFNWNHHNSSEEAKTIILSRSVNTSLHTRSITEKLSRWQRKRYVWAIDPAAVKQAREKWADGEQQVCLAYSGGLDTSCICKLTFKKSQRRWVLIIMCSAMVDWEGIRCKSTESHCFLDTNLAARHISKMIGLSGVLSYLAGPEIRSASLETRRMLILLGRLLHGRCRSRR